MTARWPEFPEKTGFFLAIKQGIDALNIPRKQPFLLGCSAGLDSMVCAAFLVWLRKRSGRSAELFYFSHGLRPDEDPGDEALVRSFAARYALPFHRAEADVKALQKERQGGLEEACREARRRALRDCASRLEEACGHPPVLVLGHHQDDQAETVALQLGRGTGLAGLAGMSFYKDGILRPLLKQPKSALLAFAKEAELPWREDRSNVSELFLRNRIRQQLLPTWSAVLGHDVRKQLARFADNVQEDQACLDALAAEAYQALYKLDATGRGRLLRQGFERLDKALQSRVLQRFWEAELLEKKPKTQLAKTHLAAVLSGLSRLPAQRRYPLPQGCSLHMDREWLWLEEEA